MDTAQIRQLLWQGNTNISDEVHVNQINYLYESQSLNRVDQLQKGDKIKWGYI